MATFSTTGIAAELARFEMLAENTENACTKAVQAGGELLAERLSAAAPVDTGKLSRSIKAGGVDYNAGDGFNCTVMPVGENRGQNLAKIGNILEYGTSKMSARPWFHGTVGQSAGAVTQKMQEAFNEAQGD